MDFFSLFQKAKGKVIKSDIGHDDNKNSPESTAEQGEDIDDKLFNILLLTNRDSDNVGDQVIEACDLALIATVMSNLKIEKKQYQISSRAASMISQKYMATRDSKLLESAKKSICQSDIVIFGGAPLFNYLYQKFYERTAVTLELVQEYQKPAIFSAIGIECYEETHPKCQRVKAALNMDCVKQITTRDDFLALQKFRENKKINIAKVSDPAVFSKEVFKNQLTMKKASAKKKIGLFIMRANAFVDNEIDFTREDSAKFWKGLILELKSRGYDYELLTSGHFGDEAFIDYLIRNHNISVKKCVFNMNTPDKLIQKISSYDAVVSCRLHPSIISFALDIPSIGIVWNTKVKGFYDSIHYEDRVFEAKELTPQKMTDKIEKIISEGVSKNEEYLMSVYNSLFYGIKDQLCPEAEVEPYTYAELKEKIPAFEKTSKAELEEKLERKFRRTYNTYNERFEKNMKYQKKIAELTAENQRLKEELENS